jgi:hypothetical protein
VGPSAAWRCSTAAPNASRQPVQFKLTEDPVQKWKGDVNLVQPRPIRFRLFNVMFLEGLSDSWSKEPGECFSRVAKVLVTVRRRREDIYVGCLQIERIINLLIFKNLCKPCLITTEASAIVSFSWDLNYLNLCYLFRYCINKPNISKRDIIKALNNEDPSV